MSKGQVRFEGISVSRVMSRGYPDRGFDLNVKVLASETKPDGTRELVTLWATTKDRGAYAKRQSIEEHAARTTFMMLYELLAAEADKIVELENRKRKRSSRKKEIE